MSNVATTAAMFYQCPVFNNGSPSNDGAKFTNVYDDKRARHHEPNVLRLQHRSLVCFSKTRK
jgi:hypothetical protein